MKLTTLAFLAGAGTGFAIGYLSLETWYENQPDPAPDDAWGDPWGPDDREPDYLGGYRCLSPECDCELPCWYS